MTPRTPPANRLEIRVHYPLERGDIVLRTSCDWDRDLEPADVSGDGSRFTFQVPTAASYVYFKPVLLRDGAAHWSLDDNYLAVAAAAGPREVYPRFFDGGGCSVCELLEPDALQDENPFRVYRPPGYEENVLRRYPVLYMQDGQNLFFPSEAFGGKHWRVAETLELLDAMSVIDQVIVVGVYPQQRERDYTLPGYGPYGEFLTQRLKPRIDAQYRTLPGAADTAVMGSSLGGVVSFYLAWQYPEVFGMAGCLSSTFGWRDDLLDRVAGEAPRRLRLYLDSGWPGDNYEVTRSMHALLRQRGFSEGRDLMYFAFPEARHDERHWALRSHLPYQFFFGAERRQQRVHP